ncbi:MAG: LysR family transcriptional regulator [Verrucomicrobia bacterium]|nr:LysR family transcriptional regulator [Verrucomicrobiota bacterium]MCH8527494.1 LysR family transcriptional regulator [Kiritimatiellia bacterium]
MELHQLRYFVSVAETGSFSRGAERCGITQPSLSQQILKLESELGQRLFDRLGRTVQMTPSGRILLPRAQRILAEVNSASNAVQQDVVQGKGTLTIGAIPTIAPFLLPEALSELRKRFPEAGLHITEDTTDRLVQKLVRAEIDCAIMSPPVEEEHLVSESLFVEELFAILPPKHPLAQSGDLKLNMLQGQDAIVLQPMHCLSAQIDAFCKAEGIARNVTCSTSQLTTLYNLVALGMGLSLVPEMFVKRGPSGPCVIKNFSGKAPTREISVYWHAGRVRNPLGEFLADIIRAKNK